MIKNIIGIMTGTSLDGIDIYYGKFEENKFERIFFKTIDYEIEIKNQVSKAIQCLLNIEELTILNYALGQEYVRAINLAIIDCDIAIDAIAIHGQTIYHVDSSKGYSATLQLGEPAILANAFNVPIINDFRSNDIAAGNLGAPLIYLFDRFLFNEPVITLNIGGIANYTTLGENIAAADTGPGNMMVNYFAKKLYDKEYDLDGNYARSGVINDLMLEELLSHPYYTLSEYKTTGREDFGDDYAHMILEKYGNLNSEDLMRTITELTCVTIADQVALQIPEKVVVSGGGAYNKFMMQRLSELLPKKKIVMIDDYGVTSDEKEALAFAYFGYQRIVGQRFKLLNGRSCFLGKITEI